MREGNIPFPFLLKLDVMKIKPVYIGTEIRMRGQRWYISEGNEFVISDGVDLVFPYNGDYTYRIWEQESDTNLDPLQAYSLCEEGLAHVYEIASDNNEYDTEIIHTIYE